jgi:glycosyltransferase involved in cell wall biosynthesis
VTDTPHRILVLVKGLGLGGAERLVAEGVSLSADRRFRYEVAYVLPWKDQLVARLEQHGIPVSCIGGARGSMVRAGRWLVRNRHRFDLVHAHLPMTGVLARLVSGRPVVYTEHNLAGSYRPPTVFLNRLTYGRNAAVTAVSDAVASSIAGYPGPAPDVIRNGVVLERDETHIAALRRELAPYGEPLVVHVGNIRPHKGHENLIQASRLLAETHPDARIVSAGGEKYPGDLARVQARAAELGAVNLTFLGRREDAHDLIAAADLFVNPADVEGLPVAILEAMIAGTPIVATDAGGVPGVIEDGKTGWLVPTRNSQALARAIGAALDDRAEAQTRAARAQELAERDYGIDRMVTEFEDLYARVLH